MIRSKALAEEPAVETVEDRLRYKDFDEAIDEDGGDIVFRVQGERYRLSGNLPARVVLMRMTDEFADTDLSEWCKALVGDDFYAQMLEDGITMEQMVDLTIWLMQEYKISGSVAKQGEDSEENPPQA